MDDSNLQNLFAKMKTEKLSVASRAQIRERILARVHSMPTPTYREFSFMRFIWVSGTRRALVGVLAVFVFVVGGVSYVAEGALPGDSLYALKVSFNEPLRATLAVSDAAKARFDVELVERRLGEASALALEDRLEESVQEILLMQAADYAVSLRVRLDEHGDELNEDEVSALAARLESSREVRIALSERVAPPIFAAMRSTGISQGEEVSSAPAPALMMMAADVSATDSAEISEPTMLKAAFVSEDSVPTTPSQEQLRRVEEEYEKARLILDARLNKLSREREKGGRVKGVSENRANEDSSQDRKFEESGVKVIPDVPSSSSSEESGDDNFSNDGFDRRRGADKQED